MNINDANKLRSALAAMEGFNANWDGSGELTLNKALEIFNGIPNDERSKHTGHYATIYGSGGWHRYYVHMATGDVTFSAHHATEAAAKKAAQLGFELH